MFRQSYFCSLKVKVERSSDSAYRTRERIEINLFRTLIIILIFALLCTCIMPSLLTAQQNESIQKNVTKGGVYLANRGQITRTRNFYDTYPTWENIKGALPIPVEGSAWGGLYCFVLDPFDPINRAWVGIGDVQWGKDSGVWFTENLDDTNPTWNEVLSKESIESVTGFTGSKVRRIEASNLQSGLIFIVVNGYKSGNNQTVVGRSEDYGNTWTWSQNIGENGPMGVGFKLSDHDVNRMWVGASVPGRILLSEDGGKTFSKLHEFPGAFYQAKDIFVPSNANENDQIIYAIAHNGPYDYLYKSMEEGKANSWSNITYGGKYPRGTYNVVGGYNLGTNDLFYVSYGIHGPWHLMYSTDGGSTWEERYTTSYPMSAAWQNPITGHLYAARAGYTLSKNDPVAFYSGDGGYTWEDKTGDWYTVMGLPYLGEPGSSGGTAPVIIFDANAYWKPSIVLGSDDAGNHPITCAFSVNDPEIYFGECTNGSEIVSGFRFQNITISRPDEVQSAHIEFTVDGPYSNDIQIKFWGDISYSSQTFSDVSQPSNRPLTSQSINWILSPADVWNMGEKKNSPDLTPIIREVIGRYGWQSGNAISIIVKNLSSNKNHRRVFAYEREGPAKAAKLIINRSRPIGITVTPTEINLGSHYADIPFEAFLTIKNASYNDIATGSISANAAWINSIDPPNFSLPRDTETTIKISGKFPFHLGPFEAFVKINLSLPEQREIKVRIYGNVINPNPPAALITGSFVIAQFYVGDRRAFQRLLDEMQALNLTTIILTSIGDIKISGEVIRTVPVTDIGWMLDDASSRGMSVYIGMYNNEMQVPVYEFWREPLKTPIITNSVQTVREIERDYGSNLTLKGYYIVQEANVGSHMVDVINQFYTPFISQVHTAAHNKKVIAGGYMLQKQVSLNQLKDWVIAFKSNGLDIFLLQDGVGSFDNSLTTYPTMYNHFVAAREGASPIPLWAVVELFQWSLWGEATRQEKSDDNWLHPANIIRINQQIYFANAAGAAEKISWINQRHMSHTARDSYTAFGQETEHLYRGYKALYFTGSYYQNLSYSCSPQPSPQYPDRSGMLFDTIEGQLSLSEWVGFGQPTGSKVTITVDLGAIKPVSDVTAVVRSDTTANIFYPTTMTVKVSTDGTNYSSLGDMSNTYLDTAGYSKAYLWVSTAASQQARYVKIEFIHGGYWLFLSELEVYHETENTVVSVKEEPQGIPNSYLLIQNYPNPFNPETRIRYQLAENCQVSLIIYNMLGQQIRELVAQKQSAGLYSVLWDGKNDQSEAVASGVYLLVMDAKHFRHVKKMLLLR